MVAPMGESMAVAILVTRPIGPTVPATTCAAFATTWPAPSGVIETAATSMVAIAMTMVADVITMAATGIEMAEAAITMIVIAIGGTATAPITGIAGAAMSVAASVGDRVLITPPGGGPAET